MLPTELDWTLVRSFLAVMEEGSLQRAGRRLRASQPTIGRHVAELESSLGVTLFERTGRALVPTAAARKIVAHAQAMGRGAEALTTALTGLEAGAEGSVRITASQTVAAYLLPPILARLRAEAPGLAVEVVSSNALSNLLRREADIAVRMVQPAQASLIARRIARVELGAYAHRAYLRKHGTPRTPAELLGHTLVGMDADQTLLRGFRALGFPVEREQFAFRCDDHVVGFQAVRAGVGVGFLSTYLARGERQLVRVLPELPIPSMPMWLAVHRELRTSPRIRRAYDFLAAELPRALRG